MLRVFLFIYFFLFLSLIINKLYIYALFSLILIPVFIFVNIHRKNLKIEEYKIKIESAKKRFNRNKKIVPFINVNQEAWYIIELIPGVSRVRAKILANAVKKTKIKTFEEFANICDLDPALYNLDRKIIKF